MEKVDGISLGNMRQWRCEKNKNHVLGVIERVEVKLQVNGSTLRYYTSRLIIFRTAVDQGAEIPAEIEVAGTLDVKTLLGMIWICTVPGCGCRKEWNPDSEIVDMLAKMYLAE